MNDMERPSITEVWLPVVDFEGFYEVSNLGEVRHVARPELRRAAHPTWKGYPMIVLNREGQKFARTVHRMVAMAHVPGRGEGLMVRHLDGDPTNNNASNLRWGTAEENWADKIRHGRSTNSNRTHCPQGHGYSGNNLIRRTNRRGGQERVCRACERAHAWAYYHKAADWREHSHIDYANIRLAESG